MTYDWERNERDGRFVELAAALIFSTVVSRRLASSYLVTGLLPRRQGVLPSRRRRALKTLRRSCSPKTAAAPCPALRAVYTAILSLSS